MLSKILVASIFGALVLKAQATTAINSSNQVYSLTSEVVKRYNQVKDTTHLLKGILLGHVAIEISSLEKGYKALTEEQIFHDLILSGYEIVVNAQAPLFVNQQYQLPQGFNDLEFLNNVCAFAQEQGQIEVLENSRRVCHPITKVYKGLHDNFTPEQVYSLVVFSQKDQFTPQ